jgi:hypothetical protein
MLPLLPAQNLVKIWVWGWKVRNGVEWVDSKKNTLRKGDYRAIVKQLHSDLRYSREFSSDCGAFPKQ